VKALLVDLDDTLLDYSGRVEESWQEACALVAAPAGVDPAALVAAIVRSRRWFWDDPERHRRERVDMMRAWTKIAAHALQDFGVSDPTMAARIAEAYAECRWRCMTLFPGALDTLERLRERGVALALVTNGDVRHQRRKIDTHGLARFFDVAVIEGEFGVGKPDPSVYHHALAALGVRAAEASMVGDNLEWDVAAPQRLGIQGIWVDVLGKGLPEDSPVVPDRIIRAFAELLTD
jgi:putative hydrolase of the HAD superfamily